MKEFRTANCDERLRAAAERAREIERLRAGNARRAARIQSRTERVRALEAAAVSLEEVTKNSVPPFDKFDIKISEEFERIKMENVFAKNRIRDLMLERDKIAATLARLLREKVFLTERLAERTAALLVDETSAAFSDSLSILTTARPL